MAEMGVVALAQIQGYRAGCSPYFRETLVVYFIRCCVAVDRGLLLVLGAELQIRTFGTDPLLRSTSCAGQTLAGAILLE